MVHTLRLDNYSTTPRKLVLGTNSSYGTETIKIERGAEWDGLNLTATWHIPGREEPLRVALLDGDAMDVPPEVTKEAKDGVLVLAGLASGVQRASCNVEYLILEQAGVYGGADAEPTPELAAQVLEATMQAKANAEAAAQDASESKANANKAQQAAENAAADAAKAGPYAEAALAAKEAAEAASDDAQAAARAAKASETAAAESASNAAADAAKAASAAKKAADESVAANIAAIEKMQADVASKQTAAAASEKAAAASAASAKTSKDAAAKSAADADSTANSIKDSMAQISENKEAVNQLKDDLANKQDKMIAGANITIGEDGKTISSTGGGNVDNIELNQLAVFHSKNLFNPDNVEYDRMAEMPGYTATNYIEKTDEGSCLSVFMEVDPSKTYKQNAQRMVFLFDESKTCIGFRIAESFSIPANAKYAKISVHYQPTYSNTRKRENFLFNVILAESNDYNSVVASPYIQCDIPKNVTVVNSHRLYNISDIYTHWIAGEKFPIAFYGDSTTEGDATTDADGNLNPVGVTNNTLGTDYIWSGAFPARLEKFMRELTGNNSIRCYNAGFSGKDTRFAWYNYKREFGVGTAYADAKMIFLGYGINDRETAPGTSEQMSPSILYNKVYYWTEQLVRMIKLDGKQPVIMTTQPYYAYFNAYGLSRGSCESITNNALIAVANAYNLEIVDRFSSLNRIFENTNSPIVNYLHTDLLHCNDGGHKLTADLLAQLISPTITNVTGRYKLDVSDMAYDNINIFVMAQKTGKFGFKINKLLNEGDEITRCRIYSESPVTISAVFENNYEYPCKIIVNDTETNSLEVGYNVVSIVSTVQGRANFMGLTLN